MLEPKRISPENLLRLANEHIARYSHMIELSVMGNTSIRRDECRDLIAVWNEVKKYYDNYDVLSEAAKSEIYDALMDAEDPGDHDENDSMLADGDPGEQ